MRDLDKDFGENNISDSDNRENKDFFNKETGNVQNNKDLEKGSDQDEEELSEKIENNEKEEESDFRQKETDRKEDQSYQEKADAAKEEARPDETVNQQYSSCYTPPYYVPNFTVSDETQESNENVDPKNSSRGKRHKALKVMAVSLLVAICVFAAFILGILSGTMRLPVADSSSDNTLNLQNEGIVIVKNSPQMSITKNTDSDYIPQSLPEVVQKVGNSVVEISTSSVVTDRFYGQYVTSGAGSGVIITQNDDAGYLITNHHVVDDAKEIVVRLTNKDEYTATLISSSKSLDLAVLRIEKKDKETFTVAPIGDSSKLIVGQDIVAIGNPLGSLGGTVTDGIISALDRNVTIDGVSMTLLQHNAAINPGNSGGALFDMMGNLVGIVNAKTSESGIEGLGFAIPVNIAFEYLKDVMQASSIGASVDYGYNNERIYGVYVTKAYEGGSFELYDRIVSINGTEIKTLDDFYSCIGNFNSGDILEIVVVRNHKQTELSVTVS